MVYLYKEYYIAIKRNDLLIPIDLDESQNYYQRAGFPGKPKKPFVDLDFVK